MQPRTYLKHLSDFGGFDWFVLFFEADFDEVAAAYESVAKLSLEDGRWIEPSASLFDPSGTVVELADSPWSAIFHSVGRDLPLDVGKFMAELNSRVVTYEANDTAGVVELKLHLPDGTTTRYMDATDVDAENELNDDIGMPPVSGYKSNASHSEFFREMVIPEVNLYCDGQGGFVVPREQRSSVGRVRFSKTIPGG
ncbi:hypothetical protein [Novipirellula caenicola]